MAEAGKALHLIYTNDDDKFEIGSEALEALKAVTGPVAVCAVCGRARLLFVADLTMYMVI